MIANGDVVVTNDETLELFRQRIPAVRTTQTRPGDDVIAYSAIALPVSDPTTALGTWLRASVVPRLSAFVGIFLVSMTLVFILSQGISNYFRVALSFLSIPMIIVSLAWVVTVIGPVIPRLFYFLPYLLWLVLSLFASWIILRRIQPLNDLIAPGSLFAWLQQRLIVVVCVTAVVLYLAPAYTREHLTLGDSVRYVRASMYIYDHGYYPIRQIVEDFGTGSHMASYPQGPSILMAFMAWIAGPAHELLYFPGQQTASIWFLYAGLLILLHVSVIGSALFSIKALLPDDHYIWVLSAAFLLVYVPSARGVIHAGEALMWPLFTATLIAVLIGRYGRAPFAAGVVLILMVGLTLVKSEGWIFNVVLVGPWIILCIPVLKNWWRRSRRSVLGLFALLCLALVPLLVLHHQKASLGIAPADYDPFSFSRLWADRRSYFEALSRTWGILSETVPTAAFIPYPYAPLLVLCMVLVIVQATCFSWRRLIVPLGILAFLLGVPAVYVFTRWMPPTSLIDVSWDRLMVVAVISAGVCTLEMILEAQRQRQMNQPELAGAS